VQIIGDSHLKSNSIKINQFLNTKFSVCNIIKPGASINQLVPSQEEELKDLGEKDVIVISGGTNDIDNNSDKGSEVLSKMTKFMQSYNNTNIVIMSIPHKYDLDKDSRINLAIQKLNRKLKTMAQLFKHVTIIETDSNRKYYTKHGLHLNNKGKEKLARSVANLINKLMLNGDKDKPVITLNWKDEINRYSAAQVSPDQLKSSTLESSDKIANRTSIRQKKPPVTWKYDFYGQKYN
jgi:hypothetical protein